MVRYSLKPGGLLTETFPSCSYKDKVSPAWCTHVRDPVVHGMRLIWITQFYFHVGEEEDKEGTLLKSPSFTLKENWLKGNLATESKKLSANSLYLQVTPGYEKRVQGVVQLAYSRGISENNTELSIPKDMGEVLFSPATYRGYWNLGNFFQMYSTISYIVHVLLHFVILEDAIDVGLVCRHTKLCNDFGLLLADKDTTDITIKVGSFEIGAHKIVLGSRSLVLKTMLGADMVEGRTGVIALKQMSVEAVKAFVNFIYTAQIEEEKLKETAEELLVAASMYDMPDLKGVCEKALLEAIIVNNAARYMVLACLHDAALLKSVAFDFFLKNKRAVMGTEEWKVAAADNSKLILEEILAVT